VPKEILGACLILFSYFTSLHAGCLTAYSGMVTLDDTLKIIGNPDASPECLEEGLLGAGGYTETQQLTYGKENKTACVSCEETIQETIAAHPNVTSDQLRRLSKSSFVEVRRIVASNNRASTKTLQYLSKSNDLDISSKALAILQGRQDELEQNFKLENLSAFYVLLYKDYGEKYKDVPRDDIYASLPSAQTERKLTQIELRKSLRLLVKTEMEKAAPVTSSAESADGLTGTATDAGK
jgi:hypothetical protein